MSGKPSHLAIVTGEKAPALSEDGRELSAALASRGIGSEPVLWNDRSVDWAAYDGIVMRSCWDYPDDPERFRALLDELERAEAAVCNPPAVLRWNMHKSYLTALSGAGVPVPDTVVVEAGSDRSLSGILTRQGWEEAVVKPAVGAGSTGVRRVTLGAVERAQAAFGELLDGGDALVQEFVPAIADGERSIVFFGGEYSHAWNSPTVEGDVTAFEDADTTYEPSREIREQAAAALRAACGVLGVEAGELPYARVDYAEGGGETLRLLELELIEPHLGLGYDDGAVERFCDALEAYFG